MQNRIFSCEIIIIVINYNEVQKFQQADFLIVSNPVWSFEDWLMTEGFWGLGEAKE